MSHSCPSSPCPICTPPLRRCPACGIDAESLYDAAEQGHADDVAAIVAWLRAEGSNYGLSYADAIERGDWKVS